MVNGIVVDDAELRRLNLPIAGDCITKQCGNDKTKGDGKFLPPPTYKGLYEEAVQRLNKVWEESHKSNVKHLEIMTKLLKDMKKKKTKKMTKAEAFEWFKKKRVVCNNFNSVAIQRKFFEVGIKWRGGSTKATEYRGIFLFVDLNGCLTHCNSRVWFDTHEYEEISADDILSIEIVEENRSEDELVEIVELGKKIQSLLPKFSGHRHVVITEDDVILYDEGMCLFHSDPF